MARGGIVRTGYVVAYWWKLMTTINRMSRVVPRSDAGPMAHGSPARHIVSLSFTAAHPSVPRARGFYFCTVTTE